MPAAEPYLRVRVTNARIEGYNRRMTTASPAVARQAYPDHAVSLSSDPKVLPYNLDVADALNLAPWGAATATARLDRQLGVHGTESLEAHQQDHD